MPILPQTTNLSLAIYGQLLFHAFAEQLYADLVSRCHTHLLVKLAERVDFEAVEKACASYHHLSGAGKPATYSVGCLVRAVLVGWLYELSLRELEQRLYSDLLVRWFVGLGPWDETPDHTTLERFTLWVKDNQPAIYFDQVMGQVREHFPQESRQTQIGDTYAMHANAADENLARRLQHVSEKLLDGLVNSLPGAMEGCLKGYEWVNLFGVHPETNHCRLDAEQRKQRLSRIALAADELRQRVGGMLNQYSTQTYPQVREWVGYLGKVLQDEVSITLTESGQSVASELPVKKKGHYRLIGAGDPEATLRTHGTPGHTEVTLGYNVQISISTSGFIHETSAYTGCVSDAQGAPDLIEAQIKRTGECPSKLIYDKIAGCGKTRWRMEQVSQGRCSLSAHLIDLEQRSHCFGPYAFTLSEDGQSLTCPGAKVASFHYPADWGEGVVFTFLAFQCWNGEPPKDAQAAEAARERRCPLWQQCHSPKAGLAGKRTVFISNYRPQVLQAQAYNQSQEFADDMRLRPHIERVVFELTHYNGARHCRRRGLANADFQAKTCATSYNLKLWMRRAVGGTRMG